MSYALAIALCCSVQSKPPDRGPILFTFDDGPAAHSAPKILDLLDRYCIKAVWFVLGWQLTRKRHRALLKEIVARGHTLANHLWSHRSPCELGRRGVLREFRQTDRAMRKLVDGRHIRPWYRPPFGASCWAGVVKRTMNQQVVYWHAADLGYSAAAVLRKIRRRTVRGRPTIVLWHHSWRKLRALLELGERDGYFRQCKGEHHGKRDQAGRAGL